MDRTSLLVIGAGPYGLATAARAMEQGIDTIVVGRPMSFWTDHMPSGMFLRSGVDWHLDAAGMHTFEAFVDDAGIATEIGSDSDRRVLGVRGLVSRGEGDRSSRRSGGRPGQVGRAVRGYDGNGGRIAADVVVAAPGIAFFQAMPEWASLVPEDVSSHTCDLVDFDRLRGARVLIVGGRQSAYEWAALIGEAGAERIDIVHRHDEPRFDRVSWKFVDPYMDQTVQVPGWWRNLAQAERDRDQPPVLVGRAIDSRMVAAPRLTGEAFHRWPGTQWSK